MAEFSERLGVIQHSRFAWKRNFAQRPEEGLKDADIWELLRVTEERDILKNVWPAPSARVNGWYSKSASTYPVSGLLTWPRWVPRGRSLIKPTVASTTFLTRLSRRLFDRYAISLTSTDMLSGPSTGPSLHQAKFACDRYALPRRRTAQATRASFAAKAITTTLGCARTSRLRSQAPIAVCCSAKCRIAARAP